jgi:hypothetical protein
MCNVNTYLAFDAVLCFTEAGLLPVHKDQFR